MTQRVKRGERRRRQRARAEIAAGVDRTPKRLHVMLDDAFKSRTGAPGCFGITLAILPCRHPSMPTKPGLSVCPSCGARVLVGPARMLVDGIDVGRIDRAVLVDKLMHTSGPQLVPIAVEDTGTFKRGWP